MRPLKLVMSAFGPYADKVDLDLEKLGTTGLYLITGTTGAGKTTIFDAISYALYGEASGDTRESKMFRSEYADDHTETFVELIFENKGKTYTIRRCPEYMRLSKRGDKYTKNVASSELIMPDGRVITKNREVDQEIKDILGVNKSQFSQIAMVAQGEFKKLLTADTKEREKIFRDIFKTYFFENLQNQLEFNRKTIFREMDDVKKSIKNTINFISCKEDDVLKTEVDLAKDDMLTTERLIEVVSILIEQDTEEKENYEAKQKTVSEKLNEINGKLRLAKKQEETKSNLNNVTNALDEKSREIITLEEMLKSAETKQPEIEKLNGEIAKLNDKLPKFAELKKLQLTLASSQKKKEDTKREILLYKEKEKSIGDKLTKDKARLEELKSVDAELVKVKNDLSNILKRKTEIDLLKKELTKYYLRSEKLKTLKQYCIDANKLYEKLSRAYLTSHSAFLAEQAGILAEELTDDMPCPVCGSTSHPHKAEKSADAPTKEQLEKMKLSADNAREEAETLANKVSALNGQLETLKTSLENKCASLFNDFSFDKISEIVEKEIVTINTKGRELSVNQKDLEDKAKEKTCLETNIPLSEKQKKDLSDRINQSETEVATLTEKISNMQEFIDKEIKELDYKSEDEAQKQLSLWTSESEALKKAIDNAKNNYERVKSEIEKLKGSKASFEETLKDAKEFNIDELNSSVELLNAENKNNNLIIGEAKSRLDRNNEALKQINTNSKELIALEKKYSMVESLSKTANGGLSGKEKITLETYVQTTYFERIIFRANQRLRVMSNDQYELVRREEASNNRSQSGLDLDVKDYYNGSVRDVKSLSGGESFLASLSLALGLSDEVQSSSGGIRLDTMFIDEGFGSLDGETLQLAFKALMSLSNDNKLIGIISHVDTLKSKIDKQIVISKDKNNGSDARIVIQ